MLFNLLCGICFLHCIFLLNNYLLFATIIIHTTSYINYLVCCFFSKYCIANCLSCFFSCCICKTSPKSHS